MPRDPGTTHCGNAGPRAQDAAARLDRVVPAGPAPGGQSGAARRRGGGGGAARLRAGRRGARATGRWAARIAGGCMAAWSRWRGTGQGRGRAGAAPRAAAQIIPELARPPAPSPSMPDRWWSPGRGPRTRRWRKALPAGVELHLHRAATLYEPGSDPDQDRRELRRSTPRSPARRRAMATAAPPRPAPSRLQAWTPRRTRSRPGSLLPTKPDWAAGLRDTWQPGEAAAHARLTRFLAERSTPTRPGGTRRART